MPWAFATLDQLPTGLPRDLGWTRWHTVTQQHVSAFADATEAHEWIHVDEARAAQGPYGTTVAHGYLSLSLATRFQTELLVAPPDMVGINYGVDRARFPAPVPVGSQVRAHGTLMSAAPHELGARIVVNLVYECDRTDKPPCVADVVTVLTAP